MAPSRTRWGRVFLFVGAGIVSATQVGKAPPLLPAIRAELEMSLFLAGWILSTFSTIGLLFGSMAGAAADSFGHFRFMVFGLACQAVGSLIGALAPEPYSLFLTRILEGLGFLTIVVSAPTLIFQLTQPRDLRLALSMWTSFMPAGVAITMVLVPLATSFVDWRGVWILSAVTLTLYSLLLVFTVDGETRRTEPRKLLAGRVMKDALQVAASPGPLLLAVIFICYTMQWISVMGFLPTLLIEEQGISAETASLFTALIVAVNVPGNLAGGWLLQKGVRRWRMVIPAFLVLGISATIIYSSSLPILIRYLGCLIFSFTGGLIPASVLGAAPLLAPNPQLVATTNGLIMQGAQVGQVIGPPALALVVSGHGGWGNAPWLLASASIAGIGLTAYLSRSRKG